jgi:hypothetical protein
MKPVPDTLPEFDAGISVDPAVGRGVAEEFETELRAAGVKVDLEVRSSSIYAGLEWLVPTAIAVFITQKYLGTLLQEAAKDHYAIFKTAFLRLIKRTTGRGREIHLQYQASNRAKLPSGDPVVLSLWVKLRSSRSVVFIFEHGIENETAPAALDALLELLTESEAKYPEDRLTAAPSAISNSRTTPIVMRFNVAKDGWDCWVYNHDDREKPG